MHGPVARGIILRTGIEIAIDDRRLRSAYLMTTAAEGRRARHHGQDLCPGSLEGFVTSAECEGTVAGPQLSAGDVAL
jgi:hypothetical protein